MSKAPAKAAAKGRPKSGKDAAAEEEKAREAQEAAEREAMLLKKMMVEESDDLYLEGVKLQGQGKYKEALKCYKKAFEQNDEHIGAMFNYALLLERQNDRGEARQVYERCANMAKSNAAFKPFFQKIAAFGAGL